MEKTGFNEKNMSKYELKMSWNGVVVVNFGNFYAFKIYA